MIYIVKGKNGAGKTFLSNKLYDLGYNRSISCTTRKPRDNEIQGYDYNFISKEEFEKGIKSEFFAEYQQVNGTYYGTPKENLKDGVILVTSDEFEIEKIYKDKSIVLYIDAPLELRYKRVIKRGCSEKEIFNRFNKENYNFLYDFQGCFIDNGNESQALDRIIKDMEKPEYKTNNIFLKQQTKDYRTIDTNDELLLFLHFEEFLMRGIYLDKKITKNDIEKTYFKYMKKFLEIRNIRFNQEDDRYYVILNGHEYYYTLDKNKIKRREDKEEYEKEIN